MRLCPLTVLKTLCAAGGLILLYSTSCKLGVLLQVNAFVA